MSDEHFKKMKNILDTSTVYHFVGRNDRHLIRIFHWLKTLEDLADEVRESQMDDELESSLRTMITTLTNEVGQRTWMIFQDIIGEDAHQMNAKRLLSCDEPPMEISLLRTFPKK